MTSPLPAHDLTSTPGSHEFLKDLTRRVFARLRTLLPGVSVEEVFSAEPTPTRSGLLATHLSLSGVDGPGEAAVASVLEEFTLHCALPTPGVSILPLSLVTPARTLSATELLALLAEYQLTHPDAFIPLERARLAYEADLAASESAPHTAEDDPDDEVYHRHVQYAIDHRDALADLLEEACEVLFALPLRDVPAPLGVSAHARELATIALATASPAGGQSAEDVDGLLLDQVPAGLERARAVLARVPV